MASIRVNCGVFMVILLSIDFLQANQPFPPSSYYPCFTSNLPYKIKCTKLASDQLVSVFHNNFPNPNIEVLMITGSDTSYKITAVEVSQVLSDVAAGSSLTLKEIYLHELFIFSLPAEFVSTNTFPLLRTLHLSNNHLGVIDSNAFTGSFSRVQMDLGGNQFFKLEEQVFLPLLESMHGNPGSIYIVPSSIVCSCDLTWLIRDRPEFLLSKIRAQCKDNEREQIFNLESWNWKDANCPNDSNTLKCNTYATSIIWLCLVSLINKLLI